ncbi:MAG: OsmC family protein [Longimicrobiales bacterium]
MTIQPTGESEIRVTMAGAGLTIDDVERPLSPFHLLAASLATCTALAVRGWGDAVGHDSASLEIVVCWEIGNDPTRVTRIEMELHWPTLPPARVVTVERVVDLCPIHATLAQSAEIVQRVAAAER